MPDRYRDDPITFDAADQLARGAVVDMAEKGAEAAQNRGASGVIMQNAPLAAGVALLHGHPVGAVAAGGAMPVKRYSKSLGSAGLDKLAKAALRDPASLGQWGSYLAAAAQRGPDALAVTHFALSQQKGGDYASLARMAMNAKDEDQ